jgi:hypothetical protein
MVHDFNWISIALFPSEAYLPLIVDADAVLALRIPLQNLQVVRWREAQSSKGEVAGIRPKRFLALRWISGGDFLDRSPAASFFVFLSQQVLIMETW